MTKASTTDSTHGGDTAGKAPEWAAMFAPEEWAWFVATLVAELDRRGITHRIDMEAGCLHVEVLGPVPNVLGLQNLAQMCRARPRDGWPGLFRHHFDIALDPKSSRNAEALAKDWDLARDAVKIRLYREDHLPSVQLVTWHVAEGLVAVLTFDLPDRVVSVRKPDRDGWDVSDEELYETALENVRREGLLTANKIEVGETSAAAAVYVLEGSSTFFAASHALFLEDYLMNESMVSPAGFQGEFGAVIAIPQRHVVIYHPIDDLRAVAAIQSMLVTAANMFAEGPGSISSDLYWLPPDDHEGEDLLVRLPCERVDDALRFMPPPEFVELLSSLSPATKTESPSS
jgi:hypothetical protein